MAWFKNWFGTRYYALLYGHRDEQDAKRWVDAILSQWQLPRGASVLDLACGRGRHARCLADAGMAVTGVDISEASINEARATVPHADFHVHDMRAPIGEERFEAVCCLFTSIGYFDRLEDDRLVFAAVASSLKPGGRFVLDFMNTPRVLHGLVSEEEVVAEGLQFLITRVLEGDVLVKRVAVHEGGEVHHFEERVQALVPDVLEAMAQEAGFIIEGRTDGPELTPFDPVHSSRFVLWMRKPVR